jgi:quercetin dioxygenase-like cupin family protein
MKIVEYPQVEAKAYHTQTAGNASGRLLIGKADGAENITMRVFEIYENGSSDLHQHDWEHEVFVHSGRGILLCQGQEYELQPGTAVLIAGGEVHQLKNPNTEPLVFVCVIPQGHGIPEI